MRSGLTGSGRWRSNGTASMEPRYPQRPPSSEEPKKGKSRSFFFVFFLRLRGRVRLRAALLLGCHLPRVRVLVRWPIELVKRLSRAPRRADGCLACSRLADANANDATELQTLQLSFHNRLFSLEEHRETIADSFRAGWPTEAMGGRAMDRVTTLPSVMRCKTCACEPHRDDGTEGMPNGGNGRIVPMRGPSIDRRTHGCWKLLNCFSAGVEINLAPKTGHSIPTYACAALQSSRAVVVGLEGSLFRSTKWKT
ncbi:hypothetical protein B0H67DRAFT_210833 [Lasiosphaeris hirsuta]|uniref:Uncharacterized protein n=1 Tax=Lasiosphaeris hirsuta TaxID=260670 RepID=A0AA40E120_9PEZI|nr:hypothetical protein B0H67DRAFT_210833 [Lasiosphaeris hirsuta]